MANISFTRGVCRYCGCTERRACILAYGSMIGGCWWVDAAHTICSAPACAWRMHAEKAFVVSDQKEDNHAAQRLSRRI